MLAGFFVVFLVEAAYQFLKDRAHGVIIEPRMLDGTVVVEHRLRAQVDFRGGQPCDEGAQRVGLGQAGNLVVEFKNTQCFASGVRHHRQTAGNHRVGVTG